MGPMLELSQDESLLNESEKILSPEKPTIFVPEPEKKIKLE